MARRSKGQYSPALFDITQDVVGGLPIKLIEQWLGSDQGHADARRLVQSYAVTGYNVVSDSSGLTRLTQQRGLIELLALINHPKQIIHGLGTALGGQGVGIWAADNSQMFYPQSVSAAALVSTLLSVQDEVHRDCQVRIGLGAHFGEFYALSGGLYGEQSDAIEALAEHHTRPGEVVITQALRERLPPSHAFLLEPKDAPPSVLDPVWRVVDGPRLADARHSSDAYPIPYSQAFYADLLAYQSRLDDAAFGAQLERRYLQRKVVVLIEREAHEAETPELALFNNLSLSAKLKDSGLRCLAIHPGEEVKVVGPLGIYVFDAVPTALGFARLFREEFAREGITCRMGIDVGPVLLFELPSGGRDIAGMPVNIASKMAQDMGQPGRLYLSEAVAAQTDRSGFTALRYTISGVDITAYEG